MTGALGARVIAWLVVIAAASASASSFQRHRTSAREEDAAMAVDGEVLVGGPSRGGAPTNGYGISAGMGDWLTGGHHKRPHPQALSHVPRFQQTHSSGEGEGGADALFPIRRASPAGGSAYSMPMARDTQTQLSAANTPIAAGLPRDPTPMLDSEEGTALPATSAPASIAQRAANAAAHHAAAAAPAAAHHTVAGSQAYEMPTQFAGTVMARGSRAEDAEVHNPDAFFGMDKPNAVADARAALGKPLYDNGADKAQFDTIDKWTHDLASHKRVNSLHKQLLAKLHGRPLPPAAPVHHAKPAAAHKAPRFRQTQQQQRKAQAKAEAAAAAEAAAKAKADAEAAEALAAAQAQSRAATDASASESAPAPASSLDGDAEEFVAFARAMGEPIDPVAHRQRINAAVQAVADERLAHDTRFQALRAKEAAEVARRKRRQKARKLAHIKHEQQQRAALAKELAAVKQERAMLAAAKKQVAVEKRRLAKAARLRANALKRARAKASAAKHKIEQAEIDHVVPAHLLGGAVPLPPAQPPKPTAQAVAANPFLKMANAPPAVAATAVVPPAPAPAPTPIPARASVPTPPPAPVAPAAMAAKPQMTAEEKAMASYVGDQPVIFAKTEVQALVPNPPPMPSAAHGVEYVAPTPLSMLDDQQSNPITRVDSEAEVNTNNNNELAAAALAIPADSNAVVGGSPAAGAADNTKTYGSAEDLLDSSAQPSSMLQTGSAASKWKGAPRPSNPAAAAELSPVLGCILANCSVPYLTCLSSMECSAVFDCLQTTGAPIASCAKYHARMSERDKRLFGDLSDCEQSHLCFGASSEGPTDAHTQLPNSQQPQPASAPAPAPAPAAPASPPKPAGPSRCEVVCARKCRADQACANACNADCFQKRYVVQL